MSTWARAVGPWQVCGACGAPIADRAPLLLIELATTVKYRCEACAGPAPADLPLRRELPPITPGQFWSTLVPFAFGRATPIPLPLELEREPGEEG